MGLLTLVNCNAQKETKAPANVSSASNGTKEIPPMKEGGIIYFNEGENKFLKEFEMNVTFKGVSEDSRCPEGVNCIWAGAAVTQIEVMGIATRPMILNLATLDHTGKNYHQSAEFNGYTISLAELTPYPNQKDGTKNLKGKYRAGITITRTEITTK